MAKQLEARVYGQFEHTPFIRSFLRLGKRIVVQAKDNVHFMEFPSGRTIWESPEPVFDLILMYGDKPLVFNNYITTKGGPVIGPKGEKYAGFNWIYVFGTNETVLTPEVSSRISKGAIFATVKSRKLLLCLPDAKTIITSDNHKYAKTPTRVETDGYFKPFKIDGRSAVFDSDSRTDFYVLHRGRPSYGSREVLRHFPIPVRPEVIKVGERRLLQAESRRTFFDLDSGEAMCEDPLPFETMDSVFSYKESLLARRSEFRRRPHTDYVNIENGEIEIKLNGEKGLKPYEVSGRTIIAGNPTTTQEFYGFPAFPDGKLALTFPERVCPFLKKYEGRTFAFSAFGKTIYTVE